MWRLDVEQSTRGRHKRNLCIPRGPNTFNKLPPRELHTDVNSVINNRDDDAIWSLC